jgi:hypothetical protein
MHRTRLLAWSTWIAYVVVTSAFLWFGAMNGENNLISALPILFGFTGFATVGSLIISRYPHHGIGWTFVVVGLGTALENMAQQYAVYALFTVLVHCREDLSWHGRETGYGHCPWPLLLSSH